MKTKSIAQVFFGLLIVVVGLGFLMQSLGIYGFGTLASTWWPMLIVGVGLASWINNPRTWLWPVMVVVFGTLLQLRQLDIVTFNVWQLIWPTIIIIIGLSIIFGRSPAGARQKIGDDEVSAFAGFSGHDLVVTSQDFKGGSASAWFGGIKLDLRQAKVKQNATIDITCAFGGVEILVPEGWLVKVSGLPIFGGWEDKTKKPGDKINSPVLNVRGTCMFGGFDIKN